MQCKETYVEMISCFSSIHFYSHLVSIEYYFADLTGFKRLVTRVTKAASMFIQFSCKSSFTDDSDKVHCQKREREQFRNLNVCVSFLSLCLFFVFLCHLISVLNFSSELTFPPSVVSLPFYIFSVFLNLWFGDLFL